MRCCLFRFLWFCCVAVGVCCTEVDVGGGMFEVSIVGFGQERVGRNVLSVVVVSSLVCYRMFTVCGVWLFGFAMLV